MKEESSWVVGGSSFSMATTDRRLCLISDALKSEMKKHQAINLWGCCFSYTVLKFKFPFHSHSSCFIVFLYHQTNRPIHGLQSSNVHNEVKEIIQLYLAPSSWSYFCCFSCILLTKVLCKECRKNNLKTNSDCSVTVTALFQYPKEKYLGPFSLFDGPALMLMEKIAW